MAILDWYWEWVDRHVERFPRADWPPLESAYWAEMRHMLVTAGADEAIADEASRRLFADLPGFPDAHPKALKEMVRTVWREARAATIPIRPDAPCEDRDFDSRAEVNWAVCLTDEEQGVWLDLAAARLPCWRKGTKANLLLAKAWALDPKLVVDLPPPEAPMPRRGPRRVFAEYQPPKVC